MKPQNNVAGYASEYVDLSGDHLPKVDDRIRKFDLEIEGLIRDAETLGGGPSVPNKKRIAELVVLLAQLRDNSPQVLLGLLSHPQIETKEVLEIVKSSFATPGIMERVAKNNQWLLHPEIPFLIVKSPKTPAPLALKLYEKRNRR